jgi:Gpi18-like mannosyltransferase
VTPNDGPLGRDAAVAPFPCSFRFAVDALANFYFSNACVWLGALLGATLLVHSHTAPPHLDGVGGYLAYGSAPAYLTIATHGYSYDPMQASNVAYFPLYPLLIRSASRLGGVTPVWSGLFVSNLSLLVALAVAFRYFWIRGGGAASRAPVLAVLALALFPTGLFLRCVHSESLLLLWVVLALYSMLRGWPLWSCAVIVGLATASRPTGIVLVIPLGLHVWTSSPNWIIRARRYSYAMPLACSGLAIYMLFLASVYDDAFAFVVAHSHWRLRAEVPLWEKAWALATLEPLRAVYEPASPAYWATVNPRAPALLNIQFANPLYFVLALIAGIVGRWKRWLNWGEALLVIGLVAMPYATRGYEMGMIATGRFVSVAVPMYLVLGQWLARVPLTLAILLLALMGVMLTIYAALFSAGYPII